MRIAVLGAQGKMGSTLVEIMDSLPDMRLVHRIDHGDAIEALFAAKPVDIAIDFTQPEARMPNVRAILSSGAAAVVGTTGFTKEDLKVIAQWVQEFERGCFIAPNFLIGNVLMQQFARVAARYFNYAEIIEYHHEKKLDYPSGTAMRTADLIQESGKCFNADVQDRVANLAGARGGETNGIRVHAIRMPGFVASQEVLFGAAGQRLSIRHDSIDRQSYWPGIKMAIDYIKDKKELVYGLERILHLPFDD